MTHFLLFEQFERKPQWWDKYKKYQLSVYPFNISKDKVTIDLSGDIDTHPVMSWNSPTTGKRVYSYTRAYVDAHKAEKYARVGVLTEEQIKRITVKCQEYMTGNGDDDTKQAAAIISIISQTGLRPGSIAGFEKTNNRGVMTLNRKNIKIEEDRVTLDFVGKSYKKNTAEIRDGVLAHYLAQRVMKRTPFVFDISKTFLENFYKKVLEMGNFKIKDLRTHIANKLALEFLRNDPSSPPPVPRESNDIKKLVKTKLKRAFEFVSQKLNNTPAMAKSSYVNPAVITQWLNDIGISQTFVTEEREDEEEIETIGNAPTYRLPAWWESDDILLVNTKEEQNGKEKS